MIKVDNVSKNYGSFTALHSIDLEIGDGEFIAVLGLRKNDFIEVIGRFYGTNRRDHFHGRHLIGIG